MDFNFRNKYYNKKNKKILVLGTYIITENGDIMREKIHILFYFLLYKMKKST